ncbi:hypothetical protein FE257_011482 [Aspergillus nanangensis]|uniref:TauD/TfdA-like domain-containing protein n=1 Tax=Aspergillus nanangensis TaxID=2582783 RepID=A0AAD4GRE6_ASPNN|nr:hypothetical protein FE257_011482 [Aspergillus nanangensis]
MSAARYDEEQQQQDKHAWDSPSSETQSSEADILGLLDVDPALNQKMHLVNNGIIATHAAYEFHPSYPKGLTVALYVGMLTGALFWGLSADVIGRRIAFNVSLFICSVFTIAAGASPSWISLGSFVAVSAFGAGGNMILDTTVLLEYLPSGKQWLVTWLAAWWGVGCTIAGLVAWGFMPNFSCGDPTVAPFTSCTRSNNSGWRYLMYTMGAMIFILSTARVTVIRLKETPKFLLGQGKDAELVEHLQMLAAKYKRPCPIDTAQLEACGTITSAHSTSGLGLGELWIHLRSLLATKQLVQLMIPLWLSWLMLGLAYPLFNVFLPSYLWSRGVKFGVTSTYETWRNYALAQVCSIFGPIVSGHMANCRIFGRRYTMVIGGLITSKFAQNVAYPCVIAFTLQIYAACLYGYTVEVLPSAHRATGNGVSVALHRFMGIMSAVIATKADITSSAPVFNVTIYESYNPSDTTTFALFAAAWRAMRPNTAPLFEHLYPCGLMIRPVGNGTSSSSIQNVPMHKIRLLSNTMSPVILRGFRHTLQEDIYIRKASELGLDHSLDLRDSPKAMPMHFDGMFKFEHQTDESTGKQIQVQKPPAYQLFTCQAAAPRGDGHTLFASSRLFFRHLPFPWTVERLLRVTWSLDTNDGYWSASPGNLPLVVRHPVTGLACLRWHEPWDARKTKFSTFKIVIDNEEPGLMDVVGALTYDYRVCVRFAWESGDVLVSDNISMLHTRTAYRRNCDRELWRIHCD